MGIYDWTLTIIDRSGSHERMPLSNPKYLTLITALLFPGTFLATYGISAYLGHSDLVWPYISDTGTNPPESCIFGQLLNIGAVLLCFIFYTRYKQVAEFYKIHPDKQKLKKLNTTSVWLGFLGALGVSVVGNFQETQVALVHFIGASMAFGLGTIYLWVQVYFTFVLPPPSSAGLITWTGVLLALLDSLSLLT